MEENKEKKFSEPTYTSVSSSTKKNGTSFVKNAFVPFLCGGLASVLVIGVCFGVPGIRSKILSNTTKSNGLSITSGTVANTVSNTDYSNTSIAVANKILPSIVGISVEYTVNSMFGQSSTAEASGSGIIISEDGYILTNNHVINSSSSSSNSYYQITEANNLKVTLYNDDTEYDAKVVGSDSQTDLAVIKIEKTGLTAAELGDSNSVQVGEFAMAVGNPLGLQSSISCGIISAKNREVKDSDTRTTYNVIQTDAAINSGNSGGALVNADGKVIGINTLKLSGTGIEGIGFAIPINSTIDVYKELINNGKISRPYIGITGIDLDEATAKKNNLVEGVYVKSIENFSAAEKAGVQAGDVIIQADGTNIKTMEELNTIKNKHSVGDKLTIKVNRNGKEKELTLTLQEQQ